MAIFVRAKLPKNKANEREGARPIVHKNKKKITSELTIVNHPVTGEFL